MVKANNRVLLLAIVLFMLSFAFIFEGFPDTTGAFDRPSRQPDLQIIKVTTSSTEFTVDILNNGLSVARKIVVAFYERSADTDEEWQDLGTEYISEIGQEKNKTITHPWKQKFGGDREIKIILDRDNRVRESNEENNIYITEINVKTITPNLYVNNIDVVGKTVYAFIYNSGTDTNKDFNVTIYKIDSNTEIIGTATINGILGGNKERKTISFNFIPPESKYIIKVIADVNRDISESNEDRKNNVLEKEFNA